MKYIQNILLLFLGIVAFTTISCSEDDKNFGDTCNVRLTLQISRQEGNGTRATGVDALNENELNTVDLFFYEKDAAVTDAPVFFATDIQLSATTQSEVSVSMPLDAFSKLFPTDADKECLVYAIVNRPPQPENDDNALPDDNVLPADKSINSLKENTILYAPGFAVKVVDNVTNKYSPNEQYDFVMDGQAIVTRDGSNLDGEIPVERVAAKISLVINGIDDEVTDNGVTWRPDKKNVALCLRRASVRTKLGSTPDDDENIYSAFSLDDINLTSVGTTLTTKVPFYTYPTNWKDDENSRTHLILKVNWTKEGSSEPITTYYEININPAGSYTRRNSHYKIYQEVKVLGSENEEKPLVLYPCNYVILDWGNTHEGTADTESDANLNRFKYLVVDETEFEMENTSSKEIFFFSSDPIELTTFEAKWEYIGGNESQTLTLASQANITSTTTDPTTGDITYTIANTGATNPSIAGVANRLKGDYSAIIKIHNANPDDPNDRSYIYFQHNLNNNMDKDADYTEYTFTFGVQHKGNDKYKDEIKITQYPMIAIKADLNTDYQADNSTSNDNAHKGYVIIDNQTGTGTNWSVVRGLAGKNKNPNKYIITVSSLPATDIGRQFIVGDPRSSIVKTISELNNDDRSKGLNYYYPTNTDESTKEMISPKFMVASSYGVCDGSMNYNKAEKRCAAYQEDGFPAGRWRVPTEAEVKYIIQLSAQGTIPVLFNKGDSYYWSAHSGVNVNNNNVITTRNKNNNCFVRCVYDIWYWGNERLTDKEEFVYGDKQM